MRRGLRKNKPSYTDELPAFLSCPKGYGSVCMMDVAELHLHEVIKRVVGTHSCGQLAERISLANICIRWSSGAAVQGINY